MKNRQAIIVAGVIGILALVIIVTTWMSKGDIETKRALNNEAAFSVQYEGIEMKTYDMAAIDQLGRETFTANLKSSGKDPVEHTYEGVLLKTILTDSGIDLETVEAVVVYAIDGYAVSLSTDKLMEDDNVYLAYIRDDALIGTREEDGDGPYQMIIKKDQFSQYWCKYAYSVSVNE
ncbi:hypothetical protein KHM83_09430 [Fusibacter paucivorans]|uniref:Oxidoreductase molybdopterin binding domain-containing protein n=1 Tax=Fusibacter paucivorans TaxID=76009 RepID=A0ABS5PNZ9_9FIRM|nr:hypothetical protein [Fusibacter paucivorans]MBS7526898.1 hypothetical protein [Fusibacter paucivorans]